MGTSLLYHLAREGWSDCLLLEKAELTSGSTWHAAGQITHSASHYGLGKIAGYAIELYPRLERETGQSVTFHGCGSLRLAYTDDELDWLRHTTSVGAALGHPMDIIGPEEIRKAAPLLQSGRRARPPCTHPRTATWIRPARPLPWPRAPASWAPRVRRHERVLGSARLKSGEWKVSSEKDDDRLRTCGERGRNLRPTDRRMGRLWTCPSPT